MCVVHTDRNHMRNEGIEAHPSQISITSPTSSSTTKPRLNGAVKNIKQNAAIAATTLTSSNSTTTATATAATSPPVTALLLTLNVSSRAVDDSGWLQQDLIWTTVHIIF